MDPTSARAHRSRHGCAPSTQKRPDTFRVVRRFSSVSRGWRIREEGLDVAATPRIAGPTTEYTATRHRRAGQHIATSMISPRQLLLLSLRAPNPDSPLVSNIVQEK